MLRKSIHYIPLLQILFNIGVSEVLKYHSKTILRRTHSMDVSGVEFDGLFEEGEARMCVDDILNETHEVLGEKVVATLPVSQELHEPRGGIMIGARKTEIIQIFG